MSKPSRRTSRRLGGLAVLGAVAAAVVLVPSALSGQAIQFSVSVPASATAGASFNVTVRAIDSSGDVDKSYKGAHNLSFSGPLASPNGTQPSYPANPVNFDQGVGVLSVTLFNAAATTLTVSEDGTTITGTSTSITVSPGAADSLAFTQQPPSWVQKDTVFGPVKVTVYDHWGNTVPSHPVSLALGAGAPTGATLTCITPSSCANNPSDSSGVATFTSLKVNQDTINLTLSATGSPQASSRAFSVADALNSCPPTCNPSGSDTAGTTSTSTSVTGVFSGDQLAVTVDASLQIPSAALQLCGGLQTQVGSGTVFEAVETANDPDHPSWTVTATVKKAALINPSRGAALYDICLGTVNITLPPYNGTDPVTCAANPTTTPPFSGSNSWPRKGGGCAQYDSGTKKFWGNVPDAAGGQKTCSTPAPVRSPVVLSKTKTGAGDLVITFCVPYPWDGWGGGH